MVVVGAPRLLWRRVDLTKREKIKKEGRRRWWHVAAQMAPKKGGLDRRWRDESGGASNDSFCTTKYGSPDKNTFQKSCWKTKIVPWKKDNKWNGTLEIGKKNDRRKAASKRTHRGQLVPSERWFFLIHSTWLWYHVKKMKSGNFHWYETVNKYMILSTIFPWLLRTKYQNRITNKKGENI